MRIALIADIHHGTDRFTKKGTAALGLLDDFTAWANAAAPDLVIDLGDRITDRDRDHDIALETQVAEAFRAVNVPVFHICGNHDRDFLSVEDNEAIFGQPLANATADIGGWRIVLWRADSRIRRAHADGMTGFVLPEADLLWLARVIREADRPLAIFSHVPVSGHAQTGNYYFERNPNSSTYPLGERIRATLRAATVPVVCVAGHVHWNTLTTVDGIPHFTLQSLTEAFTTHPEPAAAWAMLELDDHIAWQVHGRDPFVARLVATTRRWVTPLPPFADLPESQARRHSQA
jgi:Icc-related predicted phosphoesterase